MKLPQISPVELAVAKRLALDPGEVIAGSMNANAYNGRVTFEFKIPAEELHQIIRDARRAN